jgi:N-acyl homoserine lactone hydrolase
MGELTLYLLDGGMVDADRAVIHPGDDSHRRVSLPCMQILIEQDGYRVLFDTGMPPAASAHPDGLQRVYGMDPSWIRVKTTHRQRIDEQLRMLGLQPTDLDLVVNTHFHFDHAGGNALFAGVTIAAQEAELVAVRETDDYLPVWDAPGLEFRSVVGDWSPMPGVEMFLTPGHTPGHQSMLVRLGEQPWLFTWDAVYTEEHWRKNLLGAVNDVPSARASMERLRAIAAREHACVIFGHDAEQWAALGMSGTGRPRVMTAR